MSATAMPTKDAGSTKVTTPGDRELTVTRVFDAPRRAVFEFWTRPELMKRWLFGPDGWSRIAEKTARETR